MPLEFIYLNSPPVVAVNCYNRKAMRKEKWHKVKFEKSTKNDSIEFREQKTEKENKPTNFVCLYLKISNYNFFNKKSFFYLKSVIFRFVQKPS